jgi:DNA-binding response OmpR family regulator
MTFLGVHAMTHIGADHGPQPAQYQGKRVLICEDDPRVGMCIASVLQEVGIDVTGPMGTAEEALAECFRQPPDLALIDIGLSGAIDGISLAAEIATLGVPVIFLTGDYQRACVEGREFAADILIKPISVPTFLNSVNSVLRTKVE